MKQNKRFEKIGDSIKALSELPQNEEIKLPNLPYNQGGMGMFGIVTRKNDKIVNIAWEGCRDRFQSRSDQADLVEFLFCCQNNTSKHVIDFMRTVEQLLKLSDEHRLQISRTTNKNIIHVRISPWWKYRLRRSLMTALLRSGMSYTEQTAKCFEKALYSQYYLKATKEAVEHFIYKGRTASKLKKRVGFSGWYAQFANKKDKGAREVLTRLNPPKPEENQDNKTENQDGNNQ